MKLTKKQKLKLGIILFICGLIVSPFIKGLAALEMVVGIFYIFASLLPHCPHCNLLTKYIIKNTDYYDGKEEIECSNCNTIFYNYYT